MCIWKLTIFTTSLRLGKGLLASERSERDTIRGVQVRADAVRIYMCGGTYAIIVAHATYT